MFPINTKRKLIINQVLYSAPQLKKNIDELLTHCDTLKQLNAWLEEKLQHHYVTLSAYFSEKHFEKLEEKLNALGIEVIAIGESQYPQSLLALPDPPQVIFAKGNLKLLQEPQIAIVGTRQASAYGIQVSRLFSSQIAKKISVVSGLAKGIDAQAHQAALLQDKKTIAVCACGLDTCYPYNNQSLFDQIAAEGCLVSEFPLFSKPLKFQFLQRNRLIAALSLGIFVPEAGFKSGALNTVQHGLELGKDIFVSPGSIFSPHSKGSLKLLKEGAICVTEAQDILSNYIEGPSIQGSLFEETLDPLLSEDSRKILSSLNQFPMHLDDLAKHTQLPLTTVLSNLTELELEQKVDIKGGYVSRIQS